MASFGENLRRERELRGVDLREMADATKISIRFLRALEEDRVDILPGGIFPRAFVRQYARYLGLDAERLVAEFVYAHGGEAMPLRGPKPEVRVDQGTPKGLVALGVGLVVLALLGWLWARSRPDEARAVSVASTAPPTTFAGDRVYPPPVTGGLSAVDGLMVRLDAREASWVEVRADGAVILSRVMPQGETQRIKARREVVLSLSNAGGIAVAVNERPVAPLGAAGEFRRNVVINAQTLPVLQAGAVPSPSPRRRPRSSPSPSPSPSPEASPLDVLPTVPSAGPLSPAAPTPSPAPSPVPRF